MYSIAGRRCNRLENAVKPQQRCLAFDADEGCNKLENAVKPQQNAGKTSLYSIFTYLIMLFIDLFLLFCYI